MKHTMKRALSVLLAGVLLFGSVAVGSATFAADTGYGDGDVIEFGSYPQSRVTDAETLAALDASEKTWSSYRHYAQATQPEPDYDPDYKMIAEDFMQYTDVELNGKTYRGVQFSKYRPTYSTGTATDYVGSNPPAYQSGYVCGTVYWFSWDPIRWHVLDAQTGLVFAENVMDVQAFNPVYYQNADDKIWYRDKTCAAYASEYAQSFVREWLTDRACENGFANEAFSDWQWNQIERTALDNSQVKDADKPYAGADTNDPMFFFSTYELYGEVQYTTWKDRSRWNYPGEVILADATDYARCQGVECTAYGNRTLGTWMTRTISTAVSSYGPNYAVHRGDEQQFVGQQVHGTSGVRPAMRISPALLRSGDLTEPQNLLSGPCGENVQWLFDAESGVLSLTGTGAMDPLGAFDNYGYSAWKDDIRFVAAGDGVTSVGAHAFEGCAFLEEVILGEDVTVVGEAAFADCPRLMNVTLLSGTIAADGAFPGDRTDWMLIFPEDNTQALALARQLNAAWIPVSYKDGVLSFGGTITVHDGYAYSYLPMFVQRYGSAQKVYFNRLVFADVSTQSVTKQDYTGDYFGCLTMYYVEVTLLYVSPDGEQEEITYDRMIELLQSGDYRAFKLRVSSTSEEGEQKTQEEIIEQKLSEIFPHIPKKVLRIVSKAINFIVSIFKKS